MDHTKYLAVIPGSIDSHCHLTVTESKSVPIRDILTACFAGGMRSILDIGIKPDDLTERIAMTRDFPGVRFAVGVHPAEAQTFDEQKLRMHLASPLVVAVGETGLDWYRGRDRADAQYASFEQQLDLAREHALPVVIHNRDATNDIHRLLKRSAPPRGGVMHCYSAEPEWIDRFVDLGFVISFAGNVTYRNADDLRHAAARVPNGFLLAETDAPFLAPTPARGRSNHPGYLAHTCRVLAEVRNTPVERLVEEMAVTFERVFPLRATDTSI